MVVSQHKLRVHQDVRREYQSRDTRVCQLNGAVVWEERCHESKQDQRPEAAKEVWHPRREIVLGLAREECQGDEDPGSQQNGLEDDARFVEGGDDRDSVGLETREASKEEEVGWVGLSFPVGEEHECHGSEKLQ